MGINIEITGADFSQLNLGRLPDGYIDAFNLAGGGTLTPTETAALQTAYDAFITKGIWDKIIFFHPFVGSTAAYHKLNLKNYADSDSAYRLTFQNDSTAAHTNKGFVGNRTAQRSANTHFLFSGDVSATFFGIYNTIGETNDANSRAVMGSRNLSGGNINSMLLARNFANLTQVDLSVGGGTNLSSSTVDRAKTGFLGISNISTAMKLWDGASPILSSTKAIPLAGGTVPLQYLDYYNDSSATHYYSDAALGSGIGIRGVTEQNVTDAINIIIAFNQALGR